MVGDGLNLEPGVERRDECALFQFFCSKKFALKDHAKASDRRVYCHRGSVEPKFVEWPEFDPTTLRRYSVQLSALTEWMRVVRRDPWLAQLNLLNQPRTTQRAEALDQ